MIPQEPQSNSLLYFYESKTPRLHGKTFTTTTSPGGIGVVERKAFAIQAARKFERGIEQVEETFQVGYDLHAIVFKHLIVGF